MDEFEIGKTGLRPFPAEKGHHVGIVGFAGYRVALADALLSFAPGARRMRFRMVVDGPEIQSRAIAGEVAGVGQRAGSFSHVDGQDLAEGIQRVGGVHVQVAEQDLRTGTATGRSFAIS